jgi:glutamine synthetase
VVGDAYKQHEAELPDNCREALTQFSESKLIREYLGEDFQRIYASTKQQEITGFDKHVTPIEYQAISEILRPGLYRRR